MYEIIREHVVVEDGTAIRILKFADDRFHVVSSDEDAGAAVEVIVCKTLDQANTRFAASLAPARVAITI